MNEPRLFLRPRPRAASSSSPSERSGSPQVMNSNQSLENMPRLALTTEDEGQSPPSFQYVFYAHMGWACFEVVRAR